MIRRAFPFALCIARMWVMPLGSSFWVDEAETAFVVHHGVHHPSLAIIAPALESVYYWLPRASESIFGFSEAAERLPSLVALAIALFFIARIAARLIHPEAAWFAVFACLTLRVFNYEAADARAYALGTCVAAASLWLLIRWLDSGRWLDGILFLAAGALLWRVHLVYWPFYFVYAIYFLARSDRKASWVQVVTICAGLVLALAAGGDFGPGDESDAAQHVFTRCLPGSNWANVQDSLGRGCALGAWILAAGAWRRDRPAPSFSAIALIAGWWPSTSGLVRVLAHQRHQRVHDALRVHRAAGRALAATAAAAYFIPKSLWQPLALVMGLAALVFGGQWRNFGRRITIRIGAELPGPRTLWRWDRPRRCWSSARSSKPSRRSGARITRSGLPVLPAGRVSGQRQALSAALWRFARGKAVRRRLSRRHASGRRAILDLRPRRRCRPLARMVRRAARVCRMAQPPTGPVSGCRRGAI